MAFSVKGKSIKDIMELSQNQLNKLSESDLKKVTGRLVSASNKRIRRLQAKGLNDTYALNLIGGEQFSIKGLSKDELISEFSKMSHFLSLKTSSSREVEKAIKKVEKATGYTLNEKETETLNKAYGAFKDAADKGYAQSNYNQVRDTITELIATGRNGLVSQDDIIQKAEELGHEQKIQSYEERKAAEESASNFSEFFNAGSN